MQQVDMVFLLWTQFFTIPTNIYLDATKSLHSSKSFETNERESFELECTGDAGLFVNLIWKKDDKPIVLSNSITIQKSGSVLEDQKIVLSVNSSKPEDSGFYECIGTPARVEDAPVISGTQVVINSKMNFFVIQIYQNLGY